MSAVFCVLTFPFHSPPPLSLSLCVCDSHDIISSKVSLFCHKQFHIVFIFIISKQNCPNIPNFLPNIFSSRSYLHFAWLPSTCRHTKCARLDALMQNYICCNTVNQFVVGCRFYFVKNLSCQVVEP